MSRVGKRIITIPEGTTINITGSSVEVTGKLGTLKREFSPLIAIAINGNEATTTRANEEKHTKQLHGTTNSILQGMVTGVTDGFVKEIEMKGVGYKMSIEGKTLVVNAGYSHPHKIEIPETITAELGKKPTELKLSGVDKALVGHMAAIVRDIRRPNPYSGKGIMYKGEQIIRKEGKAAAK